MPIFPTNCVSLEQQVYVFYAFIKLVHIVGVQYIFRKWITETVSTSEALPAQLWHSPLSCVRQHQSTSLLSDTGEWKIGKVTGFSHEGPFPPLHLQPSCQPKRSKGQENEKVGIARIGKSDFFLFIITSLPHGSTPPPGPFTSTAVGTHTLPKLLPLISTNAGLCVW